MTKWLIVGTVLQLIMVISGHYNEFIAQNVFALGGMTISLVAGAAYGISAGASRAAATMGGVVVGGGCALIGIALSVILGDVPPMILALGTLSSAITGAIGAFGASIVGGRRPAAT
jgi:hypothetical protein